MTVSLFDIGDYLIRVAYTRRRTGVLRYQRCNEKVGKAYLEDIKAFQIFEK